MKRFCRNLSLLAGLLVLVSTIALTKHPALEVSADAASRHGQIVPADKPAGAFFPVAVWYSGGKARAPMLETITRDSQPLEGRLAEDRGPGLQHSAH
jgi:hypothetical protein